MRVIGGSFGADGKVQLDSANIVINGQAVGRSRIQKMSAEQSNAREFSLFAFLSGALILTPLCWWAFGIYGAIIAFVLTLVAAFEKEPRRVVSLTIEGGKSATIQCKKKDAARLMEFAPK